MNMRQSEERNPVNKLTDLKLSLGDAGTTCCVIVEYKIALASGKLKLLELPGRKFGKRVDGYKFTSCPAYETASSDDTGLCHSCGGVSNVDEGADVVWL
jgi:hypothetical protein